MTGPSSAAPALASEAEPLPRMLAGRYRLVAALGGGGMSAAYRAWDDGIRRLVAVKVPGGSQPESVTFLRRFDQEIRTAAGLVHPHIVPVLDFGLAEGRPYLVMPFLAGGTLAARVPRTAGGRSLAEAAAALHRWLPAIAEALDHAHAAGVLHRDVKPANIFFDAAGLAFLGDFGIVKLLADATDGEADAGLTRTNVAVGTEYYMAPERFDRRPLLDGRSDQYALAVCVYELLAGHRPFRGETGHIAVEHCTAPVPALPAAADQLPESLRAALDRGLSKRAADRFASCAEFARAVLADVPAPAAETGFLTVSCPRCGRLLRLPAAAGGRNGTCRSCRTSLAIAADGSAVWPVGEDDPLPVPIDRVRPPAVRPRRWPLAAAVAAGLAGIAAMLGWLVMAPSPPRPAAAVPSETATPPPAEVASTGGPDRGSPEESPSTELPATLPAAEPTATATDIVVEPAMTVVAGVNPVEPAEVEPAPPAEPPVAAADAPGEPVAVVMQDPPAPPPAEGDPEPVAAAATLADELHWVPVGDPGNAADANGLGGVAEPFLIGRYEVTNAEYCRFLTESEAGRENRHGVADGPTTASTARGAAAILRHGEPGEYRYEVAVGMELMPVVELRWCDAARLANWLHNGGRPDSDTETGAYLLQGLDPADDAATPRQPGATVWIPTRDEWHKAAYYKGGGDDAGYWKYPVGAAAMPKACGADEQGLGVPDGKSANFTRKSRWPGGYQIGDGGCLTAVGSNGPPGTYGTFDMAGNAAELVTLSAAEPGQPPVPALCGGHAGSTAYAVLAADAPVASGRGGLRLARAMPEAGEPTVRPPIEHLRPEAVPKPVQVAADTLATVLDLVVQASREQATPTFFQKHLAVVAGIKDLRLPASVRQLRDEARSLLAEGKAAAEAHQKAVGQLYKAAGALRGFGLAQTVDELLAVDMRTVQADFDAAREPITTRARALLERVEAVRANRAGQ